MDKIEGTIRDKMPDKALEKLRKDFENKAVEWDEEIEATPLFAFKDDLLKIAEKALSSQREEFEKREDYLAHSCREQLRELKQQLTEKEIKSKTTKWKEFAECDFEGCKYRYETAKKFCLKEHPNWVNIDWQTFKEALAEKNKEITKIKEQKLLRG